MTAKRTSINVLIDEGGLVGRELTPGSYQLLVRHPAFGGIEECRREHTSKTAFKNTLQKLADGF